MDTENPGSTPGGAVGATPERPTRSRTTWRSRSRWLVHLCLLASVAGAFRDPATPPPTRNAIHADVGLVFSGLVIDHLAQRRHPIARVFAQLMRVRPRSYVSWHRMRSSPSSQSMSRVQGSSTGAGENSSAPALSTAIPEVASDLVCCGRRVSDSPPLAPVETNPTVLDPIVP